MSVEFSAEQKAFLGIDESESVRVLASTPAMIQLERVGESGPRAREMREDWVLQIRNQCVTKNVPFFFKQWGGVNKKRTGRLLHGQVWDALPMRRDRWSRRLATR